MSDHAKISASILPAADPAWLALRQEEIIEPSLPVIDPHHHLWGAPRGRYLADELYADATVGHNVIATVFVDCTEGYRLTGPENMKPVGETEFVVQVSRDSAAGNYGKVAMCAGIVGRADLTEGASVEEVLLAHIEAGSGYFKGIRQSTAWDPSPDVRTTARTPPQGVLLDRTVREGFAKLQPLGLTFDAWVYHHQLGDVIHLAKAFPDQPIVLDHCGGPIGIGPYAGKRDEVFQEWKKGILALAECPNVTVKLGGLAMRLGGFGFHEQPVPPSSEDLAVAWAPYIHTCIEAFGPQRSMFESNFPVDQISTNFAVLWNAFKRMISEYSADEKNAMLSGTASEFYNLGGSLKV